MEFHNNEYAPRSHDREDTTSVVHVPSKDLFNERNLELGNVDDGTDTGGNQGGRDGIGFQVGTPGEITNSKAKDDQWWSNQSSDHGKTMLQSHQQGEEVRDLFI